MRQEPLYPVTMRQEAPYPVVLHELVTVVRYRPGWSFLLADIDRGQGSVGLTLVITVRGLDAYHPEQRIVVDHYMIVPAAAYDRRSWQRWLFEQIRLVDGAHEPMEWFTIDGERPYAPSHGPGNDPYLVREVGTLDDQRMSFRGILKTE